VSDRDASALREMERLGLKLGAPITIEEGPRDASLLVRIGAAAQPTRLSRRLAGAISVVSGGAEGGAIGIGKKADREVRPT